MTENCAAMVEADQSVRVLTQVVADRSHHRESSRSSPAMKLRSLTSLRLTGDRHLSV